MFGWLRRGRSDNPGEAGWSADPAPTPDERRDELLSAYLDDDLTIDERAELEARLETDAALRDDLDGMRVVRDTLATLEVVRAPRSFAIPAPPAPVRSGFRPFDLAARVGAMAAAVAFVAVLAGDLGGGRTPIAQDTATDNFAAESANGAAVTADDAAAADAGTDALAQSAAAPAPPPNDGAGDGGGAVADVTSPSTADQPSVDGTPEAPLLDEDAPGQPVAEATAARRATETPADSAPTDDSESGPADAAGLTDDEPADGSAPALPPNSGGSIEPAAAQSPEAAIEEGADASLDPDADALELAQPSAAAGDVERVDGGAVEGTPDPVASLGTQSEEVSATAANADAANELIEDGREVSNLAIGLGAAAAALAALSGALWWRRRAGTDGPG